MWIEPVRRAPPVIPPASSLTHVHLLAVLHTESRSLASTLGGTARWAEGFSAWLLRYLSSVTAFLEKRETCRHGEAARPVTAEHAHRDPAVPACNTPG